MNRLFAGYSWDGFPTSYYWMKGRQTYDPGLGRFHQEDPVIGCYMKPQLLDLYSYIANSPMNGIDPDGRWVDHDNPSDAECRCDPDEQRVIKNGYINATKIHNLGLRKALKVIGSDPRCPDPGTTSCENGEPHTKYADVERYLDEYGNPFCSTHCTMKCVVAHETVHQRQCRELGEFWYIWKGLFDRDFMETKPYEAQRLCLKKMLK